MSTKSPLMILNLWPWHGDNNYDNNHNYDKHGSDTVWKALN